MSNSEQITNILNENAETKQLFENIKVDVEETKEGGIQLSWEAEEASPEQVRIMAYAVETAVASIAQLQKFSISPKNEKVLISLQIVML